MAVEFGIVTSVVMPGGWHYQQKLSSGQTVKIEAFSFEDLLSNMLDFRRRHMDLCGAENATIEKVRADLKVYLCANFKQNCADASTPPVHAIGIPTYHRPIDRAGDWLAQLNSLQVEKVDYALAGTRAQVCAQCPQNIRWATPCAPCNDNILVRVQNAKGNLRTQLDNRLYMCRVFGHLNEVAVWLTDTHSTSSEHEPPPHCWKAHHGQ